MPSGALQILFVAAVALERAVELIGHEVDVARAAGEVRVLL